MANSLITLEEAKDFLDVIHSSDDSKLQMLLDGAVEEACSFINQGTPDEYEDFLASSENPYPVDSENPTGVPYSFIVGALLLLQANYQSTPDEISKLRAAAEVKLFPLRIDLGTSALPRICPSVMSSLELGLITLEEPTVPCLCCGHWRIRSL